MSRRTNRLSAELSAFAQQYRRKAQRGVEPNDRAYSREAETLMKRMPAEELSSLLNPESDEQLQMVKSKKGQLNKHLPRKNGRGP